MKILYQDKQINLENTKYEEIIENRLLIKNNKITHEVKITRPYDPNDSCDWTDADDDFSRLYYCEKILLKLHKENKI